ncbi:MAG: hypothetical protein J2P27_05375 [Actinobacteria bacterium]|nr:hypothetical protein [Actinomycetota bacterium]
MTDKSVVQEVQKELLAVVHRGHEQIRKGQDRMRKSQEQVRKSREAVTGLVNELTKSVRNAQRDFTDKARQNLPHAERILAAQHDLVDRARRAGIPEQVAAAQRTLAGKVAEAAKVAAPFVAEGRARLNQVIGARTEASQPAVDATPTAGQDAAAVAPTAETAAPKTETATPNAGDTPATGTTEPTTPEK